MKSWLRSLVVVVILLTCSVVLFAADGSSPTPSPLTLQAKILAIAGGVYAVLQVLKKILPGIGGWLAVALNAAFSIVGAIIAIPADQLFTLPTLFTLLTAILGAAGIHGTVSKLTSPTN